MILTPKETLNGFTFQSLIFLRQPILYLILSTSPNQILYLIMVCNLLCFRKWGTKRQGKDGIGQGKIYLIIKTKLGENHREDTFIH